jgi:septal ring factor EnvC (AmiA/AmiB activator)
LNREPLVKSLRPTLLFWSLMASLLLSPSEYCYAASPRDEYNKIQREIQEHTKKLKNVKKRGTSTLAEMETINKQLKSVEADLRKYRRQLINTESQISKIEKEIAENKSDIEKYRRWIKIKLRAIYKYGYHSDIIMLFLNTDDISQIMRKVKFLQLFAAYENQILNRYKDNIEKLNKQEKKLVSLKKRLIRNRENVKAEEDALENTKKKKKILLASVKKEEVVYKKMLKELKQASQKILEIIRESEKEQKAVTFAAKNFSTLKGKLPWPVLGKIAIPYGSQKDPVFNTPLFRSGAYIQAHNSAVAKAIHTGKVVFAEWFKGYGQLVILNHGEGYHTLYGSLSEIFTHVGDIIKNKQAVGRVGTSGIMNSPGLYFELRYKGKPLDPSQWLQKR